MNACGARHLRLRVALAAAVLATVGLVSLASGSATSAATSTAAPATFKPSAALRAVAAGPPVLPDGCAEVPTIDGAANGTPEILCGSNGRDEIHAGIGDTVYAGAGADKIWARNGAPNDVHGGAGVDTAYVDSRIDRVAGIQRRYTSMRQRPAAARDVTPDGYQYNLLTVKCADAHDGSGDRYITLLNELGAGKPQIAAFNANPGIVDWQNVAWTEYIWKWDSLARKWNIVFQTEWLWDRTYDLPDYTRKKHPRNVWHSFTEGEDAEEAQLEPYTVTEPGDYAVGFTYLWYAATVPDPPGRDLADMPRHFIHPDAQDVTGDYAQGNTAGRKFYCRFP